MLTDLILKNRSYRRFFQDETIEEESLKELINLARLSASGGNIQPLKYIISNKEPLNFEIYNTLAWAGYLKDWSGPIEGERPSAYITILGDKEISKNFGCDHGIAAQSILLGAIEKQLGGCMIASIKRNSLANILNIDSEKLDILLVIALGKPKEEVVLEDIQDKSIKYWRDDSNVHHVPKRSLDEIILC